MGADHHRLRRGTAVLTASGIAYPRKAKTIITEYARGGVRVNAVAPGPVFSDGTIPDDVEQLGKTTMLERGGQVREIAEVIAFLASGKASYFTGATIPVDGGRMAA
jgi:NAD(P)-dependent dehydrogenase (short-subunit alcohol dehydrogenase family)